MLELLSKHHDLWIKMLLNLDCDYDLAQDLVQDMYIKIYDKKDLSDIKYGNDINKYFVFITLRNMYFNYVKRNNKYRNIEFIDKGYEDVNTYDYGVDVAEDKIINKIIELTESFDTPYKLLMYAYFGLRKNNNNSYDLKGVKTFAEVGLNSGMSSSTIFYHIKKIKRVLRDEFKEDAIDYFNKDYSKI